MSRFLPKKIATLTSLAGLILTQTAFAATEDKSHLSGNIGLVSKYVYRGGVENADPALQGGLEYLFNQGVSAGYWGSTLDYDMTDDRKNRGFEHDFYLAYGQEINKDWSYRLQTTGYVYHNGGTIYADHGEKRKTTGFDALSALTYKSVELCVVVMLADAAFANAGDLFVGASYSYSLPYAVQLNTSLGVSIYNSSHDDEFVDTKKDVVWNEARIGLSKEIKQTGLTASMDYVFGGEDRVGENFDNNAVASLIYAF